MPLTTSVIEGKALALHYQQRLLHFRSPRVCLLNVSQPPPLFFIVTSEVQPLLIVCFGYYKVLLTSLCLLCPP